MKSVRTQLRERTLKGNSWDTQQDICSMSIKELDYLYDNYFDYTSKEILDFYVGHPLRTIFKKK